MSQSLHDQFLFAGKDAGFASSAFSSADFDSMFVWNSFLTRTLRGALNSNLWVVALVHGYWDQRQLSGMIGFKQDLCLILPTCFNKDLSLASLLTLM
jgi:hypothetical protein